MLWRARFEDFTPMRRRKVLAAIAGLACLCSAARGQAASEFIVLRTDRVQVSTENSTHLNCSVIGTGDAAQIHCDSYSGSGIPLVVYHVALVVGSNQVGYIVSCGGGLVWRISCHPLATGQVLKGAVQGDKLAVSEGKKSRSYRIEQSAYIGPLTTHTSSTGNAGETAAPIPTAPDPSLKRAAAVEKSDNSATDPSSHTTATPDSANPKASLAISSEPTAADIYVDGEFMGNTPSLIQLPAGSHTIRIEAKGQKTWSRSITLTSGGKINLQATLQADKSD